MGQTKNQLLEVSLKRLQSTYSLKVHFNLTNLLLPQSLNLIQALNYQIKLIFLWVRIGLKCQDLFLSQKICIKKCLPSTENLRTRICFLTLLANSLFQDLLMNNFSGPLIVYVPMLQTSSMELSGKQFMIRII